ncbi:MAG: hypothetical protein FJ098_05925 [Deltaproteobacteria bacterium]|nr:hypothetical protein [Deltaproteobacteria bacterium]
MRRSRPLAGGIAAFVAALLLAQPLTVALHFLVVDHGVVLQDGHAGHGAACKAAADPPGVRTGKEPVEGSPCLVLGTILRQESGQETAPAPATDGPRGAASLLFPPPVARSHSVALLHLAPKTSPPAA